MHTLKPKRLKKILQPILFLALSFVILTACSKKENPADALVPIDGVFEKRGENSFLYRKYAPLMDKPVTVYYYIPKSGDISKMPVLFSFHGTGRDGAEQRNAWKYFAEDHGFIVIAPQFSETFYTSNAYQYGNVFTSSSYTTLNPSQHWSFQIVEALFDYFKAETGSREATYHMYGHSAGGQFVHRFLLALPNARADKVIASNAGAWTLPYAEGFRGLNNRVYGWPFAVKDSPFNDEENLKKFLGRKLYIHLGELDINEDDVYYTDHPAANAQGLNRLDRGRFFFEKCREVATKLNVPFGFQKAEVPNSGHSTLRMVYGRAVPSVSNITNPGANGAFSLIFK